MSTSSKIFPGNASQTGQSGSTEEGEGAAWAEEFLERVNKSLNKFRFPKEMLRSFETDQAAADFDADVALEPFGGGVR
jgi:hypothetical protein